MYVNVNGLFFRLKSDRKKNKHLSNHYLQKQKKKNHALLIQYYGGVLISGPLFLIRSAGGRAQAFAEEAQERAEQGGWECRSEVGYLCILMGAGQSAFKWSTTNVCPMPILS